MRKTDMEIVSGEKKFFFSEIGKDILKQITKKKCIRTRKFGAIC